MAKIKIEDLPKDIEMTPEEIKKVMGGVLPIPRPTPYQPYQIRPSWRPRVFTATPIEIP